MPSKIKGKLPMLAFLYARFSDKKQATGDSLRAQTQAARKWCQANNATLNESTYRDLGVSAFTGKHREDPDRFGLALFLNAVQEGKVSAGSSLLLFNLDRLSRESVVPAVHLFTGILSSGIRIVQLHPEPAKVFTERSDMSDIMLAIVELSRGNSESMMKRVRVSANWQGVRDKARKGGMVTLPGKHPFWLNKTANGYTVNDKAEVIRSLFRFTKEGHGAIKASQKVHTETGHKLSRSYTQTILRERLACGWWQPKDKDNKDVGEAIKLYPEVISEDEWNEVRGMVSERNQTPVRTRDRNRVYLFNRLMVDVDGKGFTVGRASAGQGKTKFIPNAYLDGSRSCVSFPIDSFEEAMVEALAEIDPKKVLPPKTAGKANELLVLKGKQATLKNKIALTTEALGGDDTASVVGKLKAWQVELNEVYEAIARAAHKTAHPQAEAWADFKNLVALTKDDDNRTRLRNAINEMVEKITVIFHGHRNWRCCWAQIKFKDSHAFRIVVIRHRNAGNTFQGPKPSKLLHDTWKEADEAVNDLATTELKEFAVEHMTELCDTYED